jgi:hypothetical protein
MKALLTLAALLMLTGIPASAAEITAEAQAEQTPITVQRIMLNSLVPVDPATLQPLLSSYENIPLTFVQLVELQTRLNSLLAQQGHNTVQATIGDIGSTTMTIQLANRPGIETNNLAETAPISQPSTSNEPVAVLGVADSNASPSTPPVNSLQRRRQSTEDSLTERYWQRFFQARPATPTQP